MANDIEVSVGFEDVQTLRRELVGISKDAKSSASVFEREYNKVERTLKATAKASQSYYSSLLNLEKVSKSASASASVFEKALNRDAVATKNLVIEKDRLAKAYVPLYAQSKLYEAELEKLNRAQALGVISDKQRQASLEQLNTSFANGTGVFSKYSQEISRRTSSMGVVMQQTGYQVGDFLVQVQSGTNPMVAFGQQATQLVGVLPLMTGLFGLSTTALIGLSAGLGIAIPLVTAIAAYFLRSSDSAKKTKESLSELEQQIKSIDSTLKDWINTKKASSAGMTVEEMFGFQSLDAAKKKVEDLKAAIQAVNDSTAGGRNKSQKRNKLLEELKVAEEGYAEALDRVNKLEAKQSEERRSNFWDQKGSMQEELSMMRAIATFGKDSAQVRNLEAQQRISNANAEIDRQVVALKLTEDQGKALKELNLKLEAERANELKNSVGQAYLDAIGLGNTNVETGVNKAAEAAKILAERMGISLAAAQKMVSLAYQPKDYSKNSYGGSRAEARMGGEPTPYFKPDTKKTKTSTGVVAGKIDTQEEYLAKLAREYAMKKKSVGMTDQQIKRNEFIFTLDEKIATMKSKVSDTEIEALRKQSIAAYDLYQAAEKQAAIMDKVTGSIETMFMSFVDGTKSVGDAFKSMLRDIIMQIYQEKVAKQAASGIGNFLSGLVGGATGGINIGKSGSLFGGSSWSANGDIVASSGIQAFANGGVVGSPTMFQHGGGLGVMGEAGPEAIMPLKRGANGKLGVQMEGSPSQGNVVVNQTFNFSANGDDSVKRIIAQAAPQIAQMTKKSMIDDRRRGGQMKSTFG